MYPITDPCPKLYVDKANPGCFDGMYIQICVGGKSRHIANKSITCFKYIGMPLKRGPIYHDITSDTAMTATEHESDFKLTTDIPYHAIKGELWGVYYDNFKENLPCYNGTALKFPKTYRM